ncbi:predicted protein [Pyrenophora tritici-repentis Pt-1C-BFP]|uniref:CCHC-type domain-containing protein n=1 Tax=Pyrenophora tritici-repentis (strain Pt-1C-BFP) TaxID=426418 RepID=B2WQ44_PYRTR|nr:uncharacterized protein PTRG_12052 [Pyrenophora tritici-repentis Pt-1C-BFP]EDU47297.1 predicted protein [Pyrenophora tritici-repentis Pt-1C-BFP]
MTDNRPRRAWAIAVGQALVGQADDLAQWIIGNNNASFDNDPADFIQALHSSPTSNLSGVLGNIIAITNGLIQQIAAGQHDLDTANLAAQTAEQQVATYQQIVLQQAIPRNRKLSHDPEKFTGTESNATKRQQNYLTFANKIKANFRNDRAYFTSEFMKIHYICGLLDSVAYTAIQEEILTIDDADDDANWAWKDSEELFKALDKLHAPGDLSRNARIELDKLNMGNTNFPNFLATFNRYANSSRRSATEKVDLLKLKVTPELLDRALTRKGSLAADDFSGWCALFQDIYADMEELQHYKSQAQRLQSNKTNAPDQHTQKAPQAPTPHPDAMDLGAVAQGRPHNTVMRPPPGIDSRQWCIDNGLCLYCKSTGHLLRDCPEKDRADQKRAQGFTPARPQFGGASNFAQNYQTQFSQKPHLQNGHPRTPPSSLQFNGFPQHSGGHPSYSSPPMQNRAMGGFIEYERL